MMAQIWFVSRLRKSGKCKQEEKYDNTIYLSLGTRDISVLAIVFVADTQFFQYHFDQRRLFFENSKLQK